MYITFAVIGTSFLSLFPGIAEADIINSISVSSNSGGNTANNGEIIEGTTNSSVDIETTVNGERLEDIHKTSSSSSIYIEQVVTANGKDASSTTYVDTEARRTDDTATENQSSIAITNFNEIRGENTESSQGEKTVATFSFFSRFFTTFSRTLTYVLSNLF